MRSLRSRLIRTAELPLPEAGVSMKMRRRHSGLDAQEVLVRRSFGAVCPDRRQTDGVGHTFRIGRAHGGECDPEIVGHVILARVLCAVLLEFGC